ncbi:unnamed protein product [Urochloa humidicola]
MKTPDKFLYIKNRSFDQCTADCSHNWSCTAYAYASLKNVDATLDQTRCLIWMGEFLDVEKFGSSSVSKKKSTIVKIVVPAMATFLLLITCMWIVLKSRGMELMERWKCKGIHGLVDCRELFTSGSYALY